MQTKPLYEAEKQIEYQKHIERLKRITNKKSRQSSYFNTIQQVHKLRHHSSEHQVRQKNLLLLNENNKLLNKLLQISQRKSIPAYSTIAPHYVQKKYNSIFTFNNPQRKRRQQEILEMNNKIARKLLTKQSEFDRSKIMKSIEQYQTMRKIRQNNRRIKLVPMYRQNGSGYDINKVSTTQNSRVEIQRNRDFELCQISEQIKDQNSTNM